MPDSKALIRYIEERRIEEDGGRGYSFVRELPPTIRDTFFALACLKMLREASPDEQIIRFLSGYENFDFNGAYYAMKCLKLTGAKVEFRGGMLEWRYKGEVQKKPCANPSTPLISYFKYGLYGMYGSSIFSSSLSAVLKRIELDTSCIPNGLVNSTLSLLDMSGRQDIMNTYMAIEILKAMENGGYPIALSSSYLELISAFLMRCTTRKGYVGNPMSNSITLESTYAGHRIAQYLKKPDPLGIIHFVASLQNENGGFRGSPFGGISSLESSYLALRIISDISNDKYERLH